MPEFMDIIDIMVMPYPAYSLFHFSPMKMFESLSMAKIIVASAQGQIRELLGNLPSAFLYDPKEGDGLASALLCACDALRLNPQLGMQSRELIMNGHTWKNRAEQVVASCEYALRSAVPQQKRRTA
jgi:glycosyltransferase involved in cell wall biosynthesis